MIDTTIIAAYAAQYAKAYKVEPMFSYFNSQFGDNYSYMWLDKLSKFLNGRDKYKTEIDEHGFELHVNDDGSLRLYLVPDHTPGGNDLVNNVDYCGVVEFRDSRKGNEVNIRNVVAAAKLLLDRYHQCQHAIERLTDELKTLPDSELASWVDSKDIDRVKQRYIRLSSHGMSSVDYDQVKKAIAILDTVPKCTVSGNPFINFDTYHGKHLIEDILGNRCGDKHNYISEDSFIVAAAIFMEDHYSSECIDRVMKLPAIFQVLEMLRK